MTYWGHSPDILHDMSRVHILTSKHSAACAPYYIYSSTDCRFTRRAILDGRHTCIGGDRRLHILVPGWPSARLFVHHIASTYSCLLHFGWCTSRVRTYCIIDTNKHSAVILMVTPLILHILTSGSNSTLGRHIDGDAINCLYTAVLTSG